MKKKLRNKKQFLKLALLVGLGCFALALVTGNRPTYAYEMVTVKKNQIHFVYSPKVNGAMQGGAITEKYFVYADLGGGYVRVADRFSHKLVKNFRGSWGHMGSVNYEWGSQRALVKDKARAKACIDLQALKLVSIGKCPKNTPAGPVPFGQVQGNGNAHNGYVFKAASSNAGPSANSYIFVYKDRKLVKGFKISRSLVTARCSEIENVSIDGATGDAYIGYHCSGGGSSKLYKIDSAVFGDLTKGSGVSNADATSTDGSRPLNDWERNVWANNNILFYEPCAPNSLGGGTGLLEGKDNKEKIWNWFVKAGIAGVSNNPAVIAGIMGNIQAESGFNPWAKNAYGYYGLYQEDDAAMRAYVQERAGSHWGEKVSDDSINEKAISAELEWLSEHSDFKTFTKKLDNVSNTSGVEGAASYAELFLVQYERAVGGKDAIQDSKVVAHMKRMYGGKSYMYQNAKGRRNNAKEIYSYATGNTAGSSSAGVTSSGSSSGATGYSSTSSDFASKVNQTAIKYADQPAHPNAHTKALPAYTEALRQVFGNGYHSNIGKDCGRFVATVLRTSEVDKEVPKVYVPSLKEHFDKHAELYTLLEGVDGAKESDLQPGDILIRKRDLGHIMIYVKKDGKGYIADASEGSRFGGMMEYAKKGVAGQYVYRVKGGLPDCSGTGEGNQNIAETAFALAWPEGTAKSKYSWPGGSATDAFKQAIDKVYTKHRSTCKRVGASCDDFVGTVVRYSGVDPHYPRSLGLHKGGKPIPKYYIPEHTDIWESIEWNGSDPMGTLKSGDVIWHDRGGGKGHTFIYAEKDGKKYIIEAAHCGSYGHVRELKRNKLRSIKGGDSVFILRAKKGLSGKVSSSTNSAGVSTMSSDNSSNVLNDTALKFAWPEGTPKRKYYYKYSGADGAPEWRKYYDSVFPRSRQTNSRTQGASCSVWVSSVLMKAGVMKYKSPIRSEDGLIKDLSESADWEEVKTTDGGKSESNYQPGDVGFVEDGNLVKHVWIYVRKNGKGYIAEASAGGIAYRRYAGMSKFREVGNRRIFRNKNLQTTGNSVNCDPCASEEGGEAGLKDGGMNLQEAQKFMETYRKEASKRKKGTYYFQGAKVMDSGCGGGTLNNCSAFSEWFVNKFTSAGPDVIIYQGSKTVEKLLSLKKGFQDGKKVPHVYAIVSMGPNSGSSGGWYNHTGVVLGIDKANDKLILGEASCTHGYGTYPRAKEYSLKKYTNGPSVFAPTYAWTDNILKGGIGQDV